MTTSGERVDGLVADGWRLLPDEDWWELYGPNYVLARQPSECGDREAWDALTDRSEHLPTGGAE